MKVIAVIPARYASTRLPAKLLKEIAEKSILQRTYEQAKKAKLVDDVVIATDDQRLVEHALSFEAHAFLTSDDHQSGTDRIAELARKYPEWGVIVNVQGDEPFINPNDIDKAIEAFLHDPLLEMTSLYHYIDDEKEIANPNNVKLVTNANNEAVYFSRSAIPFDRDKNGFKGYKKHIGLYGYRRETILRLSKLPQSPLEKLEKLEQLRALENGIKIKMLEANSKPIGIDTQEDLDKAVSFWNTQGEIN